MPRKTYEISSKNKLLSSRLLSCQPRDNYQGNDRHRLSEDQPIYMSRVWPSVNNMSIVQLQHQKGRGLAQLFEVQRKEAAKMESEFRDTSLLRVQLRNKIEQYKLLHERKQELVRRVKELKDREKQLVERAKTLSQSPKKQHPLFIVRPSFLAEKLIPKLIKSLTLQLGGKFNNLNHFQRKKLETFLVRHKNNGELVAKLLGLCKQKWKVECDALQNISAQRMSTVQQVLTTRQLQKYNNTLTTQVEYLTDLKKQEKRVFDCLNQQILQLDDKIGRDQKALSVQRSHYLTKFNIMACRDRIHSLSVYSFREQKLSKILQQSHAETLQAKKTQAILETNLRAWGVPQLFGSVHRTRKRQGRPAASQPKTHHQRYTSKTDHTQSTGLKTRQSLIL